MNEVGEVRYWIRHLRVTREDLARAVEKVGDSAAAVKKELQAKRARCDAAP